MAAPQLTIAICTYDRYALLADSIATVLKNCPVDGKRAELLIVENTIPQKRQKIQMEPGPGRRVIVCEETGLAHARNAAIANTASDIIVFLDDDAFVRPGWVEAYLQSFAKQDTALAMGGRCYPKYELQTLPAWFNPKLNGYLSCIDWGDEGRFLKAGEWVVGANIAFRRAAFQEFGMFDPSLGRKGVGTLLSNEEIALMSKIGLSRTYYEPTAAVDHFVPADRISLAWFRKRVYWQAISDTLAGSQWYGMDYAAEQFQKFVAETEPEHRNMDMFSYRPKNFEELERQLQAIYISAMIAGDGYRARAA
jgi:glucosyl-dolichyl phosphate glucuronosyltransferase